MVFVMSVPPNSVWQFEMVKRYDDVSGTTVNRYQLIATKQSG
jgi:hypothetical protein